MPRLDDLVAEQNRVWQRMQDIRALAEHEKRDFTAEERTNWDAADARLTEIDGDVERLRRADQRDQVDRTQILDSSVDPVDPTGENRSAESRKAEYREAFEAYMRRRRLTERQQTLLEGNHQDLGDNRALGQGTPEAGGYLVPPDFWNRISEAIKAFGGVVNYCNVITTSTGADLPWPTVDDTGNEGEILGENTETAEQDLTFGARKLGAYIFSSKVVRVPWALLNDSQFDIEGLLARKFGERLGRAESRWIVSGSGVGGPTGLLTGLRAPITSPVGAKPTLTYDNTVDLEHSVNVAYRDGGNCRYLLSDKGLAIFRKVKDNDGRPIWQPIPGPGYPATINGFEYAVDNSLPDPAVSGVAAVFGDFYAGMVVRKVLGIQSVRLDELYARFLQSGFFAFERMDAKPDDPSALAALKFGAAS